MSGLLDDVLGINPPDFTPVANASKEATQISAELGQAQLDEGRRQYDNNVAIARPIVEAQTKAMGQAYEQGNYNFDNFKTEGRPLQQTMRDMALGIDSPEITRQAEEAARAGVADVQSGVSNQRDQTARSMARMGINPMSGKAESARGGLDVAAAAATAGAANTGRSKARVQAYGMMGDTLNTYAGLASSAPSFYGAGTQAGGSAMGTQMAPGQALQGSMAAGAGTIMGGRQLAMNGLTGVLNSQTSVSNNQLKQLMDMGGTAAGLIYSDRRLKRNVRKLRDDPRGFGWYEFEYAWGGGRKVGVMAQELKAVMPEAVVEVGGFLAVNYSALRG